MAEFLLITGVVGSMAAVKPLHWLAASIRAWARHRYGT
jgi:hypothetical protein